ncbi:MAG: hypothetical protein Q7K42_05535, partial [Candidatus Diapherotrites archaeon]|nr:hypothetical protein [Candidatus Diapherotrites archaeon]
MLKAFLKALAGVLILLFAFPVNAQLDYTTGQFYSTSLSFNPAALTFSAYGFEYGRDVRLPVYNAGLTSYYWFDEFGFLGVPTLLNYPRKDNTLPYAFVPPTQDNFRYFYPNNYYRDYPGSVTFFNPVPISSTSINFSEQNEIPDFTGTQKIISGNSGTKHNFIDVDRGVEVLGEKVPLPKPKTESVTEGSAKEFPIKAQPVKVYDTPSKQELSCNSLELEDNAFSVSEDSELFDGVVLKNSAREDFFVEGVTLQNSNPEFSVFKSGSTSIVFSEDKAVLGLGLKAKSGTFGLNRKFTAVVSGKFSSGTKCSNIRKEFELNILPKTDKTESVDVSLFEVKVPEMVSKEKESFQVEVTNPTDKYIKVEFSGKGVSTEPKSLLVKPFTSFTKNVLFSVQGITDYIKVESKINDESISNPKVIFLSEQDSGFELSSFTEDLSGQGKTKKVSVTLKNNSDTAKFATVELKINSLDYKTEPLNIEVPANSTKQAELEFQLPPSVSAQKQLNALLSIHYDNKLIEQALDLKLDKEIILEIKAIQQLDLSYELRITATNTLSDKIFVKVDTVVPSAWTKTNSVEFLLNPLEKKEFGFWQSLAYAWSLLGQIRNNKADSYRKNPEIIDSEG